MCEDKYFYVFTSKTHGFYFNYRNLIRATYRSTYTAQCPLQNKLLNYKNLVPAHTPCSFLNVNGLDSFPKSISLNGALYSEKLI